MPYNSQVPEVHWPALLDGASGGYLQLADDGLETTGLVHP